MSSMSPASPTLFPENTSPAFATLNQNQKDNLQDVSVPMSSDSSREASLSGSRRSSVVSIDSSEAELTPEQREIARLRDELQNQLKALQNMQQLYTQKSSELFIVQGELAKSQAKEKNTQEKWEKAQIKLARHEQAEQMAISIVRNNEIAKEEYERTVPIVTREQQAIIHDLTDHPETRKCLPKDPTNPEHVAQADVCNTWHAKRPGVTDEDYGEGVIKQICQSMPLEELRALHKPLKEVFSAEPIYFCNRYRPEIVRGFMHAVQAEACETVEEKARVWEHSLGADLGNHWPSQPGLSGF